MKKLIAAVVVLFVFAVTCWPLMALADMTLSDPQGNEIRLLEEPCVSKAGVLASMPDAARANAKAAWIKFEGKVYSACYVLRGRWSNGQVAIVDESGDGGIMPAELFKVVSSI